MSHHVILAIATAVALLIFVGFSKAQDKHNDNKSPRK